MRDPEEVLFALAHAAEKSKSDIEVEGDEASIVLSIFGWQPLADGNGSLTCRMCGRCRDREALVSIDHEEESGEESRKKRAKKRTGMNPYTEHHWWCPWVRGGGSSDDPHIPGWIQVHNAIINARTPPATHADPTSSNFAARPEVVKFLFFRPFRYILTCCVI